ncbi:hypothetical protein V8F33_007259 [Rhypophila sp. PSN 637]
MRLRYRYILFSVTPVVVKSPVKEAHESERLRRNTKIGQCELEGNIGAISPVFKPTRLQHILVLLGVVLLDLGQMRVAIRGNRDEEFSLLCRKVLVENVVHCLIGILQLSLEFGQLAEKILFVWCDVRLPPLKSFHFQFLLLLGICDQSTQGKRWLLWPLGSWRFAIICLAALPVDRGGKGVGPIDRTQVQIPDHVDLVEQSSGLVSGCPSNPTLVRSCKQMTVDVWCGMKRDKIHGHQQACGRAKNYQGTQRQRMELTRAF